MYILTKTPIKTKLNVKVSSQLLENLEDHFDKLTIQEIVEKGLDCLLGSLPIEEAAFTSDTVKFTHSQKICILNRVTILDDNEGAIVNFDGREFYFKNVSEAIDFSKLLQRVELL